MDSERYRRATSLFLDASELSGEERARCIAAGCADDDELRRVVEEMLAGEETSGGFLERSPVDALRASAEPIPERIGPFEVVGLVGRGGMGTVFEAVQESPHRRVAVKVLNPEALGPAVRSRFRYEAELLARLQHPGIAQVIAAGTEEAEGGEQPWIAMELVRGQTIDRFAREQELDVAAKVELLARVADAIHHAHQRGIVHRDLKCANVLVDESGRPKVLDFGVARGEEVDVRATMATTPGLLIGTLQTMSPEQAEAAGDIDARTDVYSLGVIAYELLAGRPPLELVGLPLPLALRMIAERQPQRLGALDRRLGGDLQVVVAKALEEDRARRYASAAELAADLRRVVAGEPIEARPPTTSYLHSKLARRHRGLVASSALALVAALGGLIAFAVQSDARARAQRQASDEARAGAAIDRYLLQDLLAAPDPMHQGRGVLVVDVLRHAAAGVEAAFPDDGLVRARVHTTLGKSFLALGELESAEAELRKALAWLRGGAGDRDAQTLEAEGALVEVLLAQDRVEEGEALARDTLARQREVLGADHFTSLTTQTNLASLLLNRSRFAQAEPLVRDVLERRARVLGPAHTATLLAQENLANVLAGLGRPDEAIEVRAAALASREEHLGELHPATLLSRLNLASVRLPGRTLEDPVGTFERLVRDMREVWGEAHQHTSGALLGLARALEIESRPEEALEAYEAAIEAHRVSLGPTHHLTIEAQIMLAEALIRAGLPEEAAALAEESLELQGQVDDGSIGLGMSHLVAGEAQLAAGRPERAAELLMSALEWIERIPGPAGEYYSRRAHAALDRLPRSGDR